jgi:hypothetical protein
MTSVHDTATYHDAVDVTRAALPRAHLVRSRYRAPASPA